MSVSGMEVMNFKYGIEFKEEEGKDSPTSPRRMSRIMFRDTLVKAFR